MGPEVIYNDLTSTLLSNIGSGDISIPIATPTGIDLAAFVAAAGSETHRLRIGNEIIEVQGRAAVGGGYSLSVFRGAEGTTAAGHTIGALVEFVGSRGGVSQLLLDRIQNGTYSGFATPNNTGSLLLPTDSPAIFMDDGARHPWGPTWSLSPSPDNNVHFSDWISTGSGTAYGGNLYGYSRFIPTAPGSVPGSTAKIVGRTTQAPNQDGHGNQISPYTITAMILPEPFLFPSGNTSSGAVGWGVGWTTSQGINTQYATLEIVSDSASHNGALTLQMNVYSDVLTFLSNYATYPLPNRSAARFMRLRDDGTFRYCYISNNGVDFTQILKVSRTDGFVGGFPPVYVGYLMNLRAAPASGISLLSWKAEG